VTRLVNSACCDTVTTVNSALCASQNLRNVERGSSLSGGAKLVYAWAVQLRLRKRHYEPSLVTVSVKCLCT